MVITVTKDTFKEEVLNSKLPVVLDCYADWCGPCKMMAPIVEETSKKYEGRVKFCKLNVDRDAEVIMSYHVVSIPDFLFFKNGEMLRSEVGGMEASDFDVLVDEVFE